MTVASPRAKRALFLAGSIAVGPDAIAEQVELDAMAALACAVQLRGLQRRGQARVHADGRLRRAPPLEHVESRRSRLPWPFVTINGSIFRAER